MMACVWDLNIRCYGLAILLSSVLNVVVSELTLTAHAPVNPIESGGILSLHCQIKELPKGHRVEIYRQMGNHSEALSIRDGVESDAGDRVFLALRYMADGSVVYFLSITDITKEDSGTYLCKVIRTSGSVAEVAKESVNINVVYFPGDQHPQCASSLKNSPMRIHVGSVLVLNCTSEKGNPTVDIRWKQSGGDTVPGIQIKESKELVYAELRLTISKNYDNAVFFCKITSNAIPGESRTCHVGPITVTGISSSEVPSKSLSSDNDIPLISTSDVSPFHEQDNTGENIRTKPAQNCVDYCATYSNDVFFWVIATAVCVLLGLMFLIIGIGLCLKYKRVKDMIKGTNGGFSTTRLAVDDIYAEVEAKAAIKPYMSLDRAKMCNIPTLVPLTRN